MNITERRRNGDWMALNGDWMVTEMYPPFSRLNGDWKLTEWRLSVFTEWWRFVLWKLLQHFQLISLVSKGSTKLYLVVEFVNDFYHIHAGLKLDNPLPKLLITRELFMPKQWIGVFSFERCYSLITVHNGVCIQIELRAFSYTVAVIRLHLF